MYPLCCYHEDFEHFSLFRSIVQHQLYVSASLCFQLYLVCLVLQSSEKPVCVLLRIFLTKHQPVFCCFNLQGRQDLAENREKKSRKFDVQQLTETMKSFQNLNDSNTMGTSSDEFSKIIHEPTTAVPEKI